MSHRTRTDEALRRLRQEAPVTDERLAAPWHASSAKQAMLETIGAEPGEAGVTALPRHRGRRRGGALLFAAVLTVAALGGTAVASGIFRPDPRDTAEVVSQGQAAEGSMHAPGWRTELDAERVQCFYGTGQDDRAETTASAGSIGTDLRAADLVAACARGGRVDRRAAKLCALPAGPLRRNPKAVVLGFDGRCERYGLDDTDRFVEVDAERLLADINLRRQVEVAIRAVDPRLDGKCHPRSEIMRLVKRRIATTGLHLEIRTAGTDWPCWYVEGVVWDDNAVMVGEVTDGEHGRPSKVQPGSG
jgi:hypothetical protein